MKETNHAIQSAIWSSAGSLPFRPPPSPTHFSLRRLRHTREKSTGHRGSFRWESSGEQFPQKWHRRSHQSVYSSPPLFAHGHYARCVENGARVGCTRGRAFRPFAGPLTRVVNAAAFPRCSQVPPSGGHFSGEGKSYREMIRLYAYREGVARRNVLHAS